MSNPKKSNKPLIVGAVKERLKKKIKEIIRKHMEEVSTSGAAGSGAGSAGVPKMPMRRGHVKDPTAGLDGYTTVGKKETGTLQEKKKDGEKGGDHKKSGGEHEKSKPKSGHDAPMIKHQTPEEKLKIVDKAWQIATDQLRAYEKLHVKKS